MSMLEIGICVAVYVIAVIWYLLRRKRWKDQEALIKYEGKRTFRVNDIIPYAIIVALLIYSQVQAFSIFGLFCVVPIVFVCIVTFINKNGIGEMGILHFSDQYLFEDMEVYYIGNINGRYVVDVKGKTSHLHNTKKKSVDMDVAELEIQEGDVAAVEELFAQHVAPERHSEYPIYKRINK